MCFKSTEKKYIKKYIRSKNPADRFWFSYNFDTTESQNGSGWRGPLGSACPKSALLEPRVELFPLPPALRILNSPSHGHCSQSCLGSSVWGQQSPSVGSSVT